MAPDRLVTMHRALQFLVSGGKPYHCNAGDKIFTILANVNVFPCRRMPVVTGNVLEKELTDMKDFQSFQEDTVLVLMYRRYFILVEKILAGL